MGAEGYIITGGKRGMAMAQCHLKDELVGQAIAGKG